MSRSATETFAQLGSLIAGMVGLVTLVGYGLHVESAVSLKTGFQGMSPLTAAGLVGASVGFIADIRGYRSAAVLAAGLCALMGAALLIVHAVWGADILSPFVANQVFHLDPQKAGRTATATAGCLAALGLAELTRRRSSISDAFSAGVLIISGLALLGYAYGVEDLYRLRIFNTMALHSAVALFILAIVSLSLRPDRGWASIAFSSEPAGTVTRRQLAFILVPPIIGWVLIHAVAAGWMGPAVALATLVVTTVLPLAILVLRDGRILLALDEERRTKSALQTKLQLELEDRLADQAMRLTQESSERSKAEEALHRAQRMDAIGQLTGGIAHDFNNLLMAIRGNLELAARQLAQRLPADRFIESATEAAERGSTLTSQLLTFSRTQKLDVGPVEVDPTLHKARDLIGNAMGPNIEVKMQLDADAQWAWTDATQLELAILNLALNARDAMPDGGRLTVESRSRTIRTGEDGNEATFVEIIATDTGHGMSSEVAARAVEPFFTTKERSKGTGLGLAQVYGFVRQCGGDLHIRSEAGKGTSISMLLPRVPAIEAREMRPSANPSRVQGLDMPSKATILVIDDDDDVRAILTDALRSNGYEVHEARDGLAGLKILQNLSPALVIIDFLMPDLNGADVARRAQTLRPGLPVIFVSGYSDTMALESIPGALFLRKPFGIDRLERAVSSLLH